jgi:hypothetical protein
MIGVVRVVSNKSTKAATVKPASSGQQGGKKAGGGLFFDLRVRRKPGNAMAAMVGQVEVDGIDARETEVDAG